MFPPPKRLANKVFKSHREFFNKFYTDANRWHKIEFVVLSPDEKKNLFFLNEKKKNKKVSLTLTHLNIYEAVIYLGNLPKILTKQF